LALTSREIVDGALPDGFDVFFQSSHSPAGRARDGGGGGEAMVWIFYDIHTAA
jgi:hypothetical protein